MEKLRHSEKLLLYSEKLLKVSETIEKLLRAYWLRGAAWPTAQLASQPTNIVSVYHNNAVLYKVIENMFAEQFEEVGSENEKAQRICLDKWSECAGRFRDSWKKATNGAE